MIAPTPHHPHYAVVFTSMRPDETEGFGETARKMLSLAQRQPGFIGVESSTDDRGLFMIVSYWKTLDAIRDWKRRADQMESHLRDKERWPFPNTARATRAGNEYEFEQAALRR